MEIKSEVTKYDLYQIICSKDDLACYVPPTGIFDNLDEAVEFIENYTDVLLKPVEAETRNNVLIVEKIEENFRITDCRKKSHIKLLLSGTEELRNYLNKVESNLDNYIFQKLIKSARIEQSLFDLKVVMRKSQQGCWGMREIEYKIGGKGFIFTNFHKDTFPALLSDAVKKTYPLKFDFKKIIGKVNKLCVKTCETIERTMECSEDIEFDIAIDKESKPWFVEVNLVRNLKKFNVTDYSVYNSLKSSRILYSAPVNIGC